MVIIIIIIYILHCIADDITTSEADNPPDGEADRCPGEKVKFPRLGVQPSHSPTAQAKSSKYHL